jgi:hypothetical protein
VLHVCPFAGGRRCRTGSGPASGASGPLCGNQRAQAVASRSSASAWNMSRAESGQEVRSAPHVQAGRGELKMQSEVRVC